MRGSSPVLLGLAVGDDSVPGIGERKLSDIRPAERTTPAGRFTSEPGRNLQNDDIVWIDYNAAVSMHRVRSSNHADRRLQRLATPTPADNYISYGCVNVPAAFYDALVKPFLGAVPGWFMCCPRHARSARFWERPAVRCPMPADRRLKRSDLSPDNRVAGQAIQTFLCEDTAAVKAKISCLDS